MASPRVIVVGLGLAGTCLTRELRARGIPFAAFHQKTPSDASPAAAGLINPLAGPKFLPIPDLERFWNEHCEVYNDFGKLLGKQVWRSTTFVRGFRTEEELTLFRARLEDPVARLFIQQIFGSHLQQIQPIGPWGGYAGRGAVLDSAELVHGWSALLRSEGCLREEPFDYTALRFDQGRLHYGKTLEPEMMIFAEGWHASRNPFFDWIPFQPAKGETLTLIGDCAWPSDQVWNQGSWMFQKRPGVFRVGATFTRGEWSPGTTEAARRELLDKVRDWIDPSFEVVGQDWGVRPGVNDHRPFIGAHPEERNLAIFNGLGARGALYAPLLSRILCDHLLQGKPIPVAYHVERFRRRYFVPSRLPAEMRKRA